MDRESKGQDYTAHLLQKALATGNGPKEPEVTKDPSQPGPSHLNQVPTNNDSDADSDGPNLGDLVAIVLPGSTPVNPVVELGKVLRINQTDLSYLPFQDIGGSNYRCTAGRLGKAARDQIVFPVGVNYNPDTKLYTLLSDNIDIHNAI